MLFCFAAAGEGVVAAGIGEGVVAAGMGEGVVAAGTGEGAVPPRDMEDVPIVVDGSLVVCPTESSVSANTDEGGAEGRRSVLAVLDLLLADDTVELSSKAGGLTTALLLII